MHNQALGVLENLQIDRIFALCRFGIEITFAHSAIAVSGIKRVCPRVFCTGMKLQPGHQSAHVEIMQHHRPGDFPQQGQHVLVEGGVANLVKHPVDLVGVRTQP